MDITIRNLGSLTEDRNSATKFILIDTGVLFFGRCKWHNDLAIAAKLPEEIVIIGAGVVPPNLETADISDAFWGGWKSSGYGIVTDEELRVHIYHALLPHIGR